MRLPSPADEIRLLSVRSIHGPNYWSRQPVTRLDLTVGAFDEISSADIPGLTAALWTALPGLVEHRCSVGEHGGFLERLRRGTYAPHILEHVCLELQASIGHKVGFGRARGGDRPGEYTVVFAHTHPGVGARAATLAVELVQDAFAGELSTAEHAIAELDRVASASPPLISIEREVLCGVIGGPERSAIAEEMVGRGVARASAIVDVAPSDLLYAGLPYLGSRLAVILDARPMDVPNRYRDEASARQLVTVLVDCVPEGGAVVVPATNQALIEAVRATGRLPAVFEVEGDGRSGLHPHHALATIRGGRILIRGDGIEIDAGAAQSKAPAIELAGALAAHFAQQLAHERVGADGHPGAPLLQ